MKTFDEALSTVHISIPEGQTGEAEAARLMDTARRYKELIVEAQSSATLATGIKAWVVFSETVGVEAAIFTAFASGMMVGIEMEKP